MSLKLSTANPYMRDPESRERGVLRSVATSSAIEGIRAPFRKTTSKTSQTASPAIKANRSIKR